MSKCEVGRLFGRGKQGRAEAGGIAQAGQPWTVPSGRASAP